MPIVFTKSFEGDEPVEKYSSGQARHPKGSPQGGKFAPKGGGGGDRGGPPHGTGYDVPGWTAPGPHHTEQGPSPAALKIAAARKLIPGDKAAEAMHEGGANSLSDSAYKKNTAMAHQIAAAGHTLAAHHAIDSSKRSWHEMMASTHSAQADHLKNAASLGGPSGKPKIGRKRSHRRGGSGGVTDGGMPD